MGLSSLSLAQFGVRWQRDEAVSAGEEIAGGKSTPSSSSPASTTTALLPQADKLLFIAKLTAWKKKRGETPGKYLRGTQKKMP